jgi:hypothetical protein
MGRPRRDMPQAAGVHTEMKTLSPGKPVQGAYRS